MSWLQFAARAPDRCCPGAGLAIARHRGADRSAPLVQPAVARRQPCRCRAARAAALVAATSGDAAAKVAAVGEQAKLINAALPFSTAPVIAARAFAIPAGDDLDQRRALLCLTQAVYYEAGFEPLKAAARSPRSCSTACATRLSRNRCAASSTSYAIAGLPVQLRLRRLAVSPARPGAWQQAEQVARAALAGYVERSVGAATHYHADYVAPRWAPMLTKISKLGAHIFYRWPGAWGQPAAFTGRYIGEPRDPAVAAPAAPSPGWRPRMASRSWSPADHRRHRAAARAERRRRPARHVQGLDAQHSDADEIATAAARIAEQQARARPAPTQNDAAAQRASSPRADPSRSSTAMASSRSFRPSPGTASR